MVVGILLAQVANWQIAHPIPINDSAALAWSWNVLYGWRWMFTAVALPALVLLPATPFLPESPRWLVLHGKPDEGKSVLARIGGELYALRELAAIQTSLGEQAKLTSSWGEFLRPGISRLLAIGIALAVLQQASGINILFNYVKEVYRGAGLGMSDLLFNIVIKGALNLVFAIVAMALVHRFGGRLLMLLGCIGVGAAHLLAALAYHQHASGRIVLLLTLCAIACYAMSLAPVTWVLKTELFPNRVRANAISITVGSLWVASFALTFTFPLLHRRLGMSGTFTVSGLFCACGAAFVFLRVPETSGRSLECIAEATS